MNCSGDPQEKKFLKECGRTILFPGRAFAVPPNMWVFFFFKIKYLFYIKTEKKISDIEC